jgi:cell division protein FtsW
MRRTLTTLSISVAILTMAGLVMVLSASSVSAFAEYGSSFLFFKRQLLYAVIGGAALLGAARLPYRLWHRAWVPLCGVTFLLLLLVLHPSVGTTVGGAARWIQVGPVSLQPSELAKFAVVAACASIMARNLRSLESDPVRWIVPLTLIVGGVSLLILLQPDLGTMMVIALASFVLLFVAGVRLRLLVTTAVLSGGVGLALIMGEGYRRARFLSFLHPWSDPRNAGYQIVQSLIALGSGHVVGVGLGASRQKWRYVPNAHTDFIFSILGEELGLIGELLVLALFAALVYAGIRIALKAPDAFGRLLAGGITAWLGLQALVNLGAVTGLLPITGVPLPFVSFGGSSLIVSLGAVGVLLSIGRAALAAGASGSGTRGQAWRRGS